MYYEMITGIPQNVNLSLVSYTYINQCIILL